MKTKNKIAIATLLLCGGLLTGAGVGAMNHEVASAQEITPTFEVKSVSLRIPDATYGEGMRFTIVMDMGTYTEENVANLMTGVLLIPEYALGDADLTVDLENLALTNVENIVWTQSNEGNFMQIYLHVYNVPPAEYTTDLCVRAYVDDGNDETTPIYTDVAISSMAKAAEWLYENDADLTDEEKATLKATYLTYDVFFHDGDDVTASKGVYGEKIAAPQVADKEGYTFGGWWNKKETAQWDFENMTISGTTTNLYAKWDIVTYTAKVVRANGSEEMVEFTIENRAEKLASIALTTNNAQYTYSWVNALPSQLALNDSQVFTEKADVNNYTVTFDTDGGNAIDEQTVPYGTPASALAAFVPEKAGWTFEGWTFEDGSEIPADATVTGDITVKAKWAASVAVYTVNVYQDVNGKYSETAAQIIGGTGEANDSITLDEAWMSANELTIPSGYLLDTKKSTLSGVIAADGSLVMNVYIRRNVAISLPADLVAIPADSVSFYYLTTDIDMSGVTYTAQHFSSSFDGRGFAIKNLSGQLFNHLKEGAVVENLALFNATRVSGQGLLAYLPYANVTINNLIVTTNGNGGVSLAGGIFRQITSASITLNNVVVRSTSTRGSTDHGYIAGFASSGMTVTNNNCYYIAANTAVSAGYLPIGTRSGYINSADASKAAMLGTYKHYTSYADFANDTTKTFNSTMALMVAKYIVQAKAIGSAQELAAIPADSTASYYLTTDIDMAGETYTAMNFAGTFDGCGFAIKNLKGQLFNHLKAGAKVQNLALIGSTRVSGQGLLAYVPYEGVTINNLIVTTADRAGLSNTGGIFRQINLASVTLNNVIVRTTSNRNSTDHGYIAGWAATGMTATSNNCYYIAANTASSAGYLGIGTRSGYINTVEDAKAAMLGTYKEYTTYASFANDETKTLTDELTAMLNKYVA